MTAPAVPQGDDLLDEYKRSLKSTGGVPPAEGGDDLLDEYAASKPRRAEPVVVNAPVMGRSPFGPAATPPAAPIRMPPVVVTSPARPQPNLVDRAVQAMQGFGLPSPSAPQEREIARFGRPITPESPEPSVLEKLGEDLGPQLRPRPPLVERAATAAGEAVTHPIQTAAGIATAPLQSAAALGEFAGQGARKLEGTWQGEPVVTPGQATAAAAQLAALGVAGPAESFLGRRLAPLIGSRPAAIAAATGTGAGMGATFTPEDPGVGALFGGALGGLHATVTGARAPGRRIVYDGEAESPDVRPRIGQAPEQPAPKPRVTGTTPPVEPPAGPDFSVEDSPLLKQYLEQKGKPAPAAPAAPPVSEVKRGPNPVETPYDTPKVIEARAQARAMPETVGINTPEREQLRNDIAARLYGQGAPKKERQAYIVLGPPGAGKTSSVAGPLSQETGSLVLDPDDAKKLLPEYAAGVGANAVHKESSNIRHQALLQAITNGDNIVLPTLGSDGTALNQTLDELEARGYQVHVRLVDVPKEVAAQRAVHRYENGGHFVEPKYILQVGDRSRATYQALKSRPGIQSYEAYDNNVPNGQPPRLVERIDRAAEAAAAAAAAQPRPARVRRPGNGSVPATQPGAPGLEPAAAPPGVSGGGGAVSPPAGSEPAVAPKHEFSSTQLDLPPETAGKIKRLGARIPAAHLAEDGRETEPHITVKYGLHGSEPEKLRALLADEPPITVRLGKTSFFLNGESNAGDVVKVDVDSPDLHRLNKKIADALPHTDTHPQYKPHATIAYVKPGLGKKYFGRTELEGHTVTIHHVTFSDQNGEKTLIPLGGKAVEAQDEGLALREKYRPDLVDEYKGKTAVEMAGEMPPMTKFGVFPVEGGHASAASESHGEPAAAKAPQQAGSTAKAPDHTPGVAGRIKPDIPALLHHESESLESEGMAAPGPTEQDEADRQPFGVQRVLEEEGGKASDEDVRKLADYFHQKLSEGSSLPKGSAELRLIAQRVLGRKYESRTWKMDDVYDAIEGASNKIARQELGPAIEGSPLRLEDARRFESQNFSGRLRSQGMLARQQFSTPIPIARAAQIAAGVRPDDKVLEPTAGTGNLVNFLRDTGVKIDVNELEPRRAAVLRWLGLEPTMEDALRLPLNGKRYNVVITNPPYGSNAVGKYSGYGATPFAASDIAQRFVAAALQELVDGGRLVAVLAPNTLKPMSQSFRKWLAKEHTPVAYIESPPGAYEGRGTNTGTVLLVVDKGKAMMSEPPFTLGSPTWDRWEEAIARFANGGDLARRSGFVDAVDVAPVGQEARGETPKKPAELISRAKPATVETSEETPSGPSTESVAPTGGAVARGSRQPSGRPGRAAGEPGVRPERPAPEPRGSGEPGRGQPADVVAQAGPGFESQAPSAATPGVVPQVSRGAVDTDAARARERERELTAATASPVFAPYSLGVSERRSPHPRLVVETRAMAGMPAPPITAVAKSELLGRAWGRDGRQGGLSDEQMDAVLRGLTAWDDGHGFLASDDVGVGKTREAAGLVLEAIERGARRILYTTKNENNVTDAMREFRLVASGSEEGDFPAEMVFVGDYKRVKSGEESLPMPDKPTIYFAHSYNYKDFAPAIAEVKPTVWIADEAHEFKNQFSDRGIAWRGLHQQVLDAKGHIAYFTATPAVTLDELGYLYGLREWPIGGFGDWVDRKLGHKGGKDSDAESEKAAEASEREVREMGERTDVTGSSEEAAELDRGAKGKKARFMRGKPDVFQSKVTPAETEQVMRELKGAGKYIARDLWRGGVQFDVHEVDILGDTRAAQAQRRVYNQAAELARDITMAARKFGRMNQKVKTSGLDRALIQSYLKQLLFGLRLPTVLEQAAAGLKAGDQVVISLHSVTGDAEMEDGLSADDAETPMNERLRSAINRINTEHVKKEGQGESAEFVELGSIPEAIMVRSDLLNRLAALPALVDPVRAIEDKFGAKNVAVITGKRTAKQRKAAMGEFQSGKRTLAVISKAGKVGISLHDVNGARRRMLVADYEWSADTFKQELGRVDRTGQQSSPHVSLVASNLAGEKKFAATIAARMASLGATSKGSAESTGTDALDQFDVSDGVSLAAMKNAVTALSPQEKQYFTGSKFVEFQKTGPETGDFVPKRAPDGAGMRDFLLDLMMFPVDAANEVWKTWALERDALRTGEDVEAASARRTGRARGTVLRKTLLTAPKDPPLTLVEIKNEAGEKKGVLQGFVTPYIADIQQARGTSEFGATKSRHYVHVTTPSGELVTGLELNPSEVRRVRQSFGKGERRTMTPAEAWEDLQAGDDVPIRGAGGDRWVLHQRRRDLRIQIQGATIAKHRGPLMGVGLVRFETVGNYLYLQNDEAAVAKFLERFPPLVENAPAPATGEEGTLGGTTDVHSFTDPFTAAMAMLRAARKLHAQRMAAQAAATPRAKRLTKKQRAALLQTGPTAGPMLDAVRRLLAPGTRSAGASRMQRMKAHELAKMAQENEQAIEWLEAKRDLLDQLPAHSQKGVKDFKGPRWQWAFDMEGGTLATKDPKLALLGLSVGRLLDDYRTRVQDLGTGKLEHFIENYMPHAWTDKKAAVSWIKKVLGKRPLEGPKSFLKPRSIDTLEEGIDAGLEPISDNPLDLILFKLREINRYLAWQHLFQQGRREGIFKFFRSSKKLPDGWQWIDDNMAVVYAPRGDEGELRIRGRYAAPEPVATIVHNYLKPGLRGNPLYDSYMHAGNILNLVQLGWSGFHAGFVAFDATISTGAVGIQEMLTKGQRLQGLKHFGIGALSAATGPVTVLPLLAPTLALLRGHAVTKAYLNGTLDPRLEAIVQGLVHGGGRARMDRFYKGGFAYTLRKALRDHRWIRAGLVTPFAATELAMKPLLEHIVPRMKLGAFATLWEHELRKLPAGATTDDVEKAAKRVWDSIDNRLGQMTYDNLDWSRVVKDVLQGAIRSVGWNAGDVRELGGAVLDVARTRQRTKEGQSAMSPRMAYAVALAALVALYGAIYTYLHTGDLPGQEGGEDKGLGFLLKDLYYPRTGDHNHEGQPERVTPATYVKDVVGFSKHPITTIAHKTNPLLTELYNLVWSNENFFGDRIRNEEDPWYRQAKDVAKEVLGVAQPFTVRNLQEQRRRGVGALSQAEGFFGVTAAPREIVRTPAENLMQKYIRSRMPAGGSTPEEREAAQARAELAGEIREGKLTREDAIAQGRAKGIITTPQQAHSVAHRGKEDPFVSKFKSLTAEEAQHVYDTATPEQREKYRLRAYLRLKQARAGIRAQGGSP